MADDKDLVNQDEIERLLAQSASQQKSQPPPAQAASPPAESKSADADALNQSDIEALLSGVGGKGKSASEPGKSGQAGQLPAAGEDADKLLGQDDIEKLLNQAGKAPPAAKPAAVKEKPAAPSASSGEGDIVAEDVEFLLRQAEEALASVDTDLTAEQPAGVTSFRLEEFKGAPASSENATLDLIRDVELDVKIELGRTHMYLEDVLRLRRGSVVPLDKLAGDPVDIYVNGRLIARGEVLVLNDNFCVRVAELIAATNSA
jgi:flagellar motor switch protein FliN/FliY